MNTNIFDRKPCDDAQEWLAAQPDLKTAWDTCERGDWMWWALCLLPGALPEKKISVLFARWCARRAKKFASAPARYASASARYAYAASASARYAACASDASDAFEYAYASASDAERKAQADWIRKHVPYPLLEGVGE